MIGGTWRLSTGVRPVIRGPLGGSVPVSRGVVQSLAFGSDDGQFSEAAAWSEVIDPGQTLVLNLWSGAIRNLENQPAVFASLRSFWAAIIDGGDASGVKVAPAASNGNTLWFGGTAPYKVIFPNGPAEEGGSDAGVTVSAAAAVVELTNLGAVAATVAIALAGVGPMGVLYFPGANLTHLIG